MKRGFRNYATFTENYAKLHLSKVLPELLHTWLVVKQRDVTKVCTSHIAHCYFATRFALAIIVPFKADSNTVHFTSGATKA